MDSSPLPDRIASACLDGAIESIRVWLNEGGDIDALNPAKQSLLVLAVIRDKGALVDFLLARGASPNAGHWSAFMQAVYVGHLPWVKAMLARGANPNAADRYGTLVLHETLRLRGDACCAVATCLIEAGADPRSKNGKGLDFLGEMARLGRHGLPGNAPYMSDYETLRCLVRATAMAHDVAISLPPVKSALVSHRPRI